MDFYKKRRICKNCGITFIEIENICNFDCGRHWGYWNGTKWTCCQDKHKRRLDNPCIKHDHYDEKTETITYPKLLIDKTDKFLIEHLTDKMKFLLRKKKDFIKTQKDKIVFKRTY
jgi:hypothetical protein